jgi:hypothetical protein
MGCQQLCAVLACSAAAFTTAFWVAQPNGHERATAVEPAWSLTAPITVADMSQRTACVVPAAAPPGDVFPEDWLVLKILTANGDVAAVQRFHSSYGLFRVDLVDLTGDGVEEVVLRTGEGHGTSARSERLSVYVIEARGLRRVLQVPVSDYWGSGARWSYETEYVGVEGDRLTHLRLVLSVKKGGEPSLLVPRLVPRAKVREFRWDPKADAMVLYRETY